MSDKESKFIMWLTVIGGSIVTALLIGAFTFYSATIEAKAAQEKTNENVEIRMKNQEIKTETMRVEWREDMKEIKMNIDKIATSQIEQGYPRSYRN